MNGVITFADLLAATVAPGKDLLMHILFVLHNKAQEEEVLMSAEQLEFLWERVGPYALEHPIALQYIAHCLIDVGHYDVGPLFIGLGNHDDSVRKITEAFACVNSVFGVVGSVRLLQTLFHVSTTNNELSQAITKGISNEKEWTPYSTYITGGPRTNLEARHRQWCLFEASECVPSLRLLSLSSTNHSMTEELVVIAEDTSFELAYHNVFILLEVLKEWNLCALKGSGSNFAIPLNIGLNEVTIREVEDLTSLVNLWLPPQTATNSKYGIQDLSAAVTPMVCNASSSSALSNAEEGNTTVQLIVAAFESQECPGKGVHAGECSLCH
ncbi:hypothetical protein PENSPDRAFT_672064 [Peniophora sp. CONT]|nr:hypothetical protein PENSPDRAFT_672064 [Peniophora sp. CONT]